MLSTSRSSCHPCISLPEAFELNCRRYFVAGSAAWPSNLMRVSSLAGHCCYVLVSWGFFSFDPTAHSVENERKYDEHITWKWQPRFQPPLFVTCSRNVYTLPITGRWRTVPWPFHVIPGRRPEGQFRHLSNVRQLGTSAEAAKPPQRHAKRFGSEPAPEGHRWVDESPMTSSKQLRTVGCWELQGVLNFLGGWRNLNRILGSLIR